METQLSQLRSGQAKVRIKPCLTPEHRPSPLHDPRLLRNLSEAAWSCSGCFISDVPSLTVSSAESPTPWPRPVALPRCPALSAPRPEPGTNEVLYIHGLRESWLALRKNNSREKPQASSRLSSKRVHMCCSLPLRSFHPGEKPEPGEHRYCFIARGQKSFCSPPGSRGSSE